MEFLFELCREESVQQGLPLGIQKMAIDAFALALRQNFEKDNFKYLSKCISAISHNTSVIQFSSVSIDLNYFRFYKKLSNLLKYIEEG
jgi:hypothetical protein